ncbi:hypothetical protein [Sphingomonas sp.]|uniref:hypothetical protein n=1 Tax=Sphingomonas sp. TaxID=28214 RepID=UPI0035BC2B74
MNARLIAGFGGALVLGAIGFTTLAKHDDLCGSRVIARAVNPVDGRIAYTFIRNCGATTGILTNIAIGEPTTALEKATVVFTADDSHGKADRDTASLGAIWTQVGWTGPRHLSVMYAEQARVYRSAKRLDGALISYRTGSVNYPLPPPPPPENF